MLGRYKLFTHKFGAESHNRIGDRLGEANPIQLRLTVPLNVFSEKRFFQTQFCCKELERRAVSVFSPKLFCGHVYVT